MRYIWQHPQWPNFEFDPSALQPTLLAYERMLGLATGSTDQIDNTLQSELIVDLLVSEAINTSGIEGETLNREDVRSSIKNYLGLNAVPSVIGDARAEGIAALLVDARSTYAQPLTANAIFEWHKMIMPDTTSLLVSRPLLRGAWRNDPEPMQIVSGPLNRPIVHFEAPSALQVPREMETFIDWFNATALPDNTLPGPVRAAIAHLWFETVHPLDDGNGRIGRALAEKALMQSAGGPTLYSLSTTILARRKDYYRALNEASLGTIDITPWIQWFCSTVLAAQHQAKYQIAFVLAKAKFWRDNPDNAFNARQLKAITRLFAAGPEGFQGGMTASKYANLTGCSKATATRDLADLLERKLLLAQGSTRSTHYELACIQNIARTSSHGRDRSHDSSELSI